MNSQQKQGLNWLNENNPFLLGEASIPTRTLAERASSRAIQVVEPPLAKPAAAVSDDEDWKLDAHWTAITSYLAEMYFPKEG
jgi:hypothetical protein